MDVDVFIPRCWSYANTSATDLGTIRAAGQQVGCYTSGIPDGPAGLNWYLEYPAIRSRLMLGAGAWKDGLEYAVSAPPLCASETSLTAAMPTICCTAAAGFCTFALMAGRSISLGPVEMASVVLGRLIRVESRRHARCFHTQTQIIPTMAKASRFSLALTG